jgi:hypothetical protein
MDGERRRVDCSMAIVANFLSTVQAECEKCANARKDPTDAFTAGTRWRGSRVDVS